MKEHKVPTKDDLLEFMKKHGPESVDSITDKDSVIKHFRTSSKLYKQQCDQYKRERDNFENMLNEECERGFQMEGKYRDMKTQRDTLIEDLSWYKAKVNRLEQRVTKLVHENVKLQNDLYTEQLNEDEADFVIGKLENKTNVYNSLLTEFSQHIGSNPSSSTYKKFRKQLDDIGIRESE